MSLYQQDLPEAQILQLMRTMGKIRSYYRIDNLTKVSDTIFFSFNNFIYPLYIARTFCFRMISMDLYTFSYE